MNREAMEKLRLDRRLIGRRGWISKAELEKDLEGLPDVAHKIAPSEEEKPSEAAPAEEAVSGAAGGGGAALETTPPRLE